MGRKIFNKIEDELSNENPNLQLIIDELERIKDEYIDMESQVEELDDQVSELEDKVDDLEEEVFDLEKELRDLRLEEEETLDDYFLNNILLELRQRWRYSSVKLEQKLKESDIL